MKPLNMNENKKYTFQYVCYIHVIIDHFDITTISNTYIQYLTNVTKLKYLEMKTNQNCSNQGINSKLNLGNIYCHSVKIFYLSVHNFKSRFFKKES